MKRIDFSDGRFTLSKISSLWRYTSPGRAGISLDYIFRMEKWLKAYYQC